MVTVMVTVTVMMAAIRFKKARLVMYSSMQPGRVAVGAACMFIQEQQRDIISYSESYSLVLFFV